MTTEQARVALEDAGLRLRSTSAGTQFRRRAGQGHRPDHPSGSQVSEGTEVGITVSTAGGCGCPPSSADVEEAITNLESAGFQVETNMVDSTGDEQVLSASNEADARNVVPRSPSGLRGNQFTMPTWSAPTGGSGAAAAGRLAGNPDRSGAPADQLDPTRVERVVGQSRTRETVMRRNHHRPGERAGYSLKAVSPLLRPALGPALGGPETGSGAGGEPIPPETYWATAAVAPARVSA